MLKGLWKNSTSIPYGSIQQQGTSLSCLKKKSNKFVPYSSFFTGDFWERKKKKWPSQSQPMISQQADLLQTQLWYFLAKRP